jgi:hypothetical protein
MDQNLNFSGHNNLDTIYNHTDSHSMTSNNISRVPIINSPNTFSSVPQCCHHVSQSDNYFTNGQPASNHIVNLPNSTIFDSSQPQVNHYKFEIPGFEIIVKPKSNVVMNLSNLNTQHQSYMNSYSPVAVMVMATQNQNDINGNFVSNSHVNSVNNMDIFRK